MSRFVEAGGRCETSLYLHTVSLERRDGLISAHVSPHQPEPLGKGFMRLRVLRSANFTVLNDAVCIFLAKSN